MRRPLYRCWRSSFKREIQTSSNWSRPRKESTPSWNRWTLKLKWCRTRSKTSSAIPNGTRRNFWTKETVSWRTRLSWTSRGPPCKQRLLIYILSWKIQSMITNSKKPSSIDMKTTKNSRIRRRSSPWMSNISSSWNHISLRKFIIYF